MNILVLNGSPKGEKSVTMQYVKYMKKVSDGADFTIRNVAHDIRTLEKSEEAFQAVMDEVRGADGVLWAFPLYVCVAHADYMRFIELIGERGAASAFTSKPAAALTTSIHFFDHTAHNYMHAVCDDLGMNYLGFFSADMEEMHHEQGRRQLELFTEDFLQQIGQPQPILRQYAPITAPEWQYAPGAAHAGLDTRGKHILLITEGTAGNPNLRHMAERLIACFPQAEVVDLNTIRMLGGCRGCLRCGLANECMYGDSDDIAKLYNEQIRQADIVVFAAALQGRFLSAKFKTFMDRRFQNTHQPQMIGKQIAYLICGPLGQTPNVAEVLQAIAELDQANLVGIVTDEGQDSAALDARLDALAAQMLRHAASGYRRPATFLGVGGQKLFRDDIYSRLRFPFLADHRFYKKHQIYDFPQKNRKSIWTGIVMSALCKVPQVRKAVFSSIPDHMITGYQQYL